MSDMRVFSIGLFLSLLCTVTTAQVQSFTMQQAIDFALENHNEIKAAMFEVADADGNVKEYTAIGMPKVSGSVELQHFINIPTSIIPSGSFFAGDPSQNIPPNPVEDLKVQFGVKNNLSAGLSADVLLFDGSFFIGLRAAKLFKEMVAQQVDITKDELAVNVAKAYVGVLLAKRSLDLIQKNIINLDATLFETQQTFEAGFIEKLDVDRLSLSLNNLRLEEEKSQSLILISKNVLKFSMGLPMSEEIETAEAIEDVLLAEYEQATVDQMVPSFLDRPEYIVLQSSDALNELKIQGIKYGYLPVLRGFGSYSQILQGNKISGGSWFPTSVVGLTLQVPIFDGLDKSAKMDRARIARDKNRLSMNSLEKAISLEVENAKLSYLNALKTVNAMEQSQALAQDIYDTTLIKYKEGVGSSVELSQAERDLYSTQTNYTNAIYELLLKQVDLEKSLGRI